MKLIGSGSVMLADGERVSVQVGDYMISFVPDDAAPTMSKEFMVRVPHGYALGRVSTTNSGESDGVRDVKLRVMFMPCGAHGEMVNANYSLLEIN